MVLMVFYIFYLKNNYSNNNNNTPKGGHVTRFGGLATLGNAPGGPQGSTMTKQCPNSMSCKPFELDAIKG